MWAFNATELKNADLEQKFLWRNLMGVEIAHHRTRFFVSSYIGFSLTSFWNILMLKSCMYEGVVGSIVWIQMKIFDQIVSRNVANSKVSNMW